jgi:hypothetical protein
MKLTFVSHSELRVESAESQAIFFANTFSCLSLISLSVLNDIVGSPSNHDKQFEGVQAADNDDGVNITRCIVL